jgi:hypothetical protein
MLESIPEVTFTPRASGDGTWYVEIASPGLAGEEIGDFRSRTSAEAWIRDMLRNYAPTVAIDSEAYSADAKICE